MLTGFDIEDRRDRGERILATQTYFQNTPGALARSRPAASDPIDVVLTRTTAQPGALTVASTMPKPQHELRSWWVQVGEFRSRQAARAQIESVAHRFARIFDDAEGTVDGGHNTYRARFSGLTEVAAHEACSTVKTHGVPCMASDRA